MALVDIVFSDVFGAFGLALADFGALRRVNAAAAAVPLTIEGTNDVYAVRFRLWDLVTVDFSGGYVDITARGVNHCASWYDYIYMYGGRAETVVFVGRNCSTQGYPQRQCLFALLNIEFIVVNRRVITYVCAPSRLMRVRETPGVITLGNIKIYRGECGPNNYIFHGKHYYSRANLADIYRCNRILARQLVWVKGDC